jgi:predicted 2-oxoglutarate/Fe(II)-dependent dioxygenase YbiX
VPPPSTFSAFGFFVQPAFLDQAERQRLLDAMRASEGVLAGIASDAPAGTANPEVRRAWEVEIDDEIAGAIEARLEALRPVLERHFATALEWPDAPSFLRYPAGAFYRPHRDRAASPDASGVDRRAVSIVVFINDARTEPGFAGGQLRFYGLFDEPALADVGLDAEPEAGTLLAFPSHVLHEVSAVRSGLRCTIVSWFLEPLV